MKSKINGTLKFMLLRPRQICYLSLSERKNAFSGTVVSLKNRFLDIA
jgi:hypothetical protein